MWYALLSFLGVTTTTSQDTDAAESLLILANESGIATQTHIDMVSVSCQTEISHEDLSSMGNELDDLREQVCELKKKCSIQEDLDNRSLSKNVREE